MSTLGTWWPAVPPPGGGSAHTRPQMGGAGWEGMPGKGEWIFSAQGRSLQCKNQRDAEAEGPLKHHRRLDISSELLLFHFFLLEFSSHTDFRLWVGSIYGPQIGRRTADSPWLWMQCGWGWRTSANRMGSSSCRCWLWSLGVFWDSSWGRDASRNRSVGLLPLTRCDVMQADGDLFPPPLINVELDTWVFTWVFPFLLQLIADGQYFFLQHCIYEISICHKSCKP